MRRFYRTLLAFAQRERHFGYALVLDSFFLDARSTFSGHLFILQDLGSHQPRSPTACMVLNSDESHALRHCAGQICGETLQFWMAMGLESDLDISLSCTSLHLQTMFYYSARGDFWHQEATRHDTTLQKQRTSKEKKRKRKKKEMALWKGGVRAHVIGIFGTGLLPPLIENSTFYQHFTLFLVFNRLGP